MNAVAQATDLWGRRVEMERAYNSLIDEIVRRLVEVQHYLSSDIVV